MKVMEGKIEGKRGPSRKRLGMIDDLLEKVPYEVLKRRAENRQEWSLAAGDLPDGRTLKKMLTE